MNNFALYLNKTSAMLESTMEHLQLLAEKEKINFLLFNEKAEYRNWFPILKKDISIDCILVLGGDGTILGAVKYSLKYKAPLLGINLGHLGFLSESSLDELDRSIRDLRNNKYKILSRMMMKATVKSIYPSAPFKGERKKEIIGGREKEQALPVIRQGFLLY